MNEIFSQLNRKSKFQKDNCCPGSYSFWRNRQNKGLEGAEKHACGFLLEKKGTAGYKAGYIKGLSGITAWAAVILKKRGKNG